MRIVSWNCNGGLRRKVEAVESLRPDILVLQEASRRDVAALDAAFHHWVGGSEHRGLAVVSRLTPSCRIASSYRSDLPWFLPVEIGSLRILAVWACVASPGLRYVRLIHHALDHYQPFLAAGPALVIGDLNSSAVFDRKHQPLSHTALVKRLDHIGLTSAWHLQTGEAHGAESSPTFYMYRHRDKPYHFDYAFVPQSFTPGMRLELGPPDPWLSLSDHLPLILDLDVPRREGNVVVRHHRCQAASPTGSGAAS